MLTNNIENKSLENITQLTVMHITLKVTFVGCIMLEEIFLYYYSIGS